MNGGSTVPQAGPTATGCAASCEVADAAGEESSGLVNNTFGREQYLRLNSALRVPDRAVNVTVPHEYCAKNRRQLALVKYVF